MRDAGKCNIPHAPSTALKTQKYLIISPNKHFAPT